MEVFKPNFDASFNVRYEDFMNELKLLADTTFKAYFDGRNDVIDYNNVSHKLWHYIEPSTAKNGGIMIAILFLRKNSNLPDQIIDEIEKVYCKHFLPSERNPLLRSYFKE